MCMYSDQQLSFGVKIHCPHHIHDAYNSQITFLFCINTIIFYKAQRAAKNRQEAAEFFSTGIFSPIVK